MMILGAGLSGLIAATQIPSAYVIEANGPDAISHRAVLRFRSDVLSRMTGIPFDKVTVRKSIYSNGSHCRPSINLANQYSRKTNGSYLDRSIWNVDPVERWIAPEDLQQQMVRMIGDRIEWNRKLDAAAMGSISVPAISTLPMHVLMGMLGQAIPEDIVFQHASIVVDRYRVKGANVYQTIYFPSPDDSVYRASITGNLLIVERSNTLPWDDLAMVCDAFGIQLSDLEVIDQSHQQRYGKITPINDMWRRQAIYDLTNKFQIYSLGRFAIWKNVLLDDVASDVAVIKRLIQQGPYATSLHHSSRTP